MQNEPAAKAASSHEGFLSAESKRHFTIVAIVIAVVALVVQMGVPLVATLVAIPLTMFKLDFKHTELAGSALHDGRIWYVASERKRGPGGAGIRQQLLMSMDRRSYGEPVEVTTLTLGSPGHACWLVAGTERLWVVSDDGTVGELQSDHLTVFPTAASLAVSSRPFAWHGQPAVLELSGAPASEMVLWAFEGGRWVERGRAPAGTLLLPRGSPRSMRVVVEDERLHLFTQVHDGTVHYAELSFSGSAASWERIAQVTRRWGVALVDGAPALFRFNQGSWARDLVITRRAGPGTWSDVLTHRMQPAVDFGVVELPAAGELAVIARLAPPGMHETVLRAGRVVEEHRYGVDPTAQIMKLAYGLQFALFPVSLLVAVLLSAQMKKHRVTELWVDGGCYRFASLNRRALAQSVDYALTAGPGLLLVFAVIDDFDRLTDVSWWLEHLWVFAVSFGLWVVGTLVYSWLEGRWGRTPGKWLFGIRVLGTDGRSCGFRRALLRNVLELADGMFHFLAGLLCVAFTKQWQRLGDLAARTVVVQAERSEPG